MKKVWLLLLLAMIASSAALAQVNFSETLHYANHWSGNLVTAPGIVRKLAPVGAVTGVYYQTPRLHLVAGRNNQPLYVYAYPTRTSNSVSWTIVRISGLCDNAAVGSWIEKIQPIVKQITTTTVVTVESELPPRQFETTVTPRYKPNPMPGMIGGREVDAGISIAYGSKTSSTVPLIVPFVMVEPEQRCEPTTPETPITCDPNGTPPDPPSVGAATGTGIGGQPAAPPSGGNQPPPQATHNTGGATWDPSPSHPKVADPVLRK